MKISIEIWSDIVCPWCTIGRRRLERALETFDQRSEVEVVWKSFQLDPDAPTHYGGSSDEMLMQRYGMSLEQAQSAHRRVTGLAAAEGLDFHFENTRPGSSFDAHRLLHLAKGKGLQYALKARLQTAYFSEGQSIGDHESLMKLGLEVGLEESAIRETLSSDAFNDAVRQDLAEARALGITGVPFFVFNRQFAVSGAQSVAVFQQALTQASQSEITAAT